MRLPLPSVNQNFMPRPCVVGEKLLKERKMKCIKKQVVILFFLPLGYRAATKETLGGGQNSTLRLVFGQLASFMVISDSPLPRHPTEHKSSEPNIIVSSIKGVQNVLLLQNLKVSFLGNSTAFCDTWFTSLFIRLGQSSAWGYSLNKSRTCT